MSVNPPSVQDAAVDSVDNFAVFFQLFLQNSEKRLNTDTLVEKGTGALYLNFINEIKYLWMGNIFIVYDIGRRRWFQTSPKICLLVNEHGHIAVKRQKLKMYLIKMTAALVMWMRLLWKQQLVWLSQRVTLFPCLPKRCLPLFLFSSFT